MRILPVIVPGLLVMAAGGAVLADPPAHSARHVTGSEAIVVHASPPGPQSFEVHGHAAAVYIAPAATRHFDQAVLDATRRAPF